MHRGVLTCAPSTPLRQAARQMSRFRVHALVVCDEQEPEAGGVLGVVTLADVVAAIDRGDLDRTSAGAGTGTLLVTVRPEEPLRRAAHLMRSAGVSHAVVVDGPGRKPVGVLSTLDLARALAAEPEPA
jgi:CBS domain-containing protein